MMSVAIILSSRDVAGIDSMYFFRVKVASSYFFVRSKVRI